MKQLLITAAGRGSVAELAANLHPDDAAEIRAAGVLLKDLPEDDCSALRLDGRLVSLFGAAPHPQKGAAVPWMLSTRLLDEVPRRRMAAVSAGVVSEWRERFSLLQNLVHCRNERALRFLAWLGFSIDRKPVGPGGEFFVFTWERATCATR